MLKKIVLAAATASVLAVTALGATTTAASAAPPPPPGHHHRHDCRPVKHTVKWYDRHGHPHWKKVIRIECGPRWKFH